MNNGNSAKKHTISLYVANKPGVLIRVALVFARRGYNIDSLVVSEAHDSDFSHMNIAASGDEKTLDQILKQLNKLIDVVHARDNTGLDVVQRELALIKVRCEPESRTEIMQISQAFKGDAVDLDEHTLTVQITGKSDKIDAVHKVFNKYGILEMVRTGKILMARGEASTS
jgi:acetolactate synthase-1/3 small subunit